MNGYGDEELAISLQDLLADHGCWLEQDKSSTALVFPDEDSDYAAYTSYFHWQWVCGLVEPDTADVYEELYRHFAHRPDDLYRLEWREYETLLARIFQSQGFDVELGPGRGDEGVDIRLIQRDPIGDIVTLVQAKKYGAGNKIDQTQVAALYGIQQSEDANFSMFVTTSAYAPVAKRFSAREKVQGRLALKDSSHVAEWCRTATDGIIRDKSTLVTPQHVQGLMSGIGERADRRLLRTTYGYNSTHNSFALVVKESNHAALLMPLPRRTISDDGHGQRGLEVPSFDFSLPHFNGDNVFRVRKEQRDGEIFYWGNDRLYCAWNGEPCHFDYYD
ncbi:restriction endonuclease [Cereibacter sphaeroides]